MFFSQILIINSKISGPEENYAHLAVSLTTVDIEPHLLQLSSSFMDREWKRAVGEA